MVKRGNAESTPLGSVRVVGGEWRGRRIPVAAGTFVRPSPDRVRETLFNWLRDLVAGARCLDLFAGTGVLGFEALSRGAAEACFVENDAKLVDAMRAQAGTFGVRPRIVRQDVESFLGGAAERFDIVFLDPPYAEPVEPLIAAVRGLVAVEGVVYVERPRAPGLPVVESAGWWKQARAGAVEYGLLRFDLGV